MATHNALLWLGLLSVCYVAVARDGYPFRPPMDLDVTPRTTVLVNGLLGCERFRGSVVNYSTLLLEEEAEEEEKEKEDEVEEKMDEKMVVEVPEEGGAGGEGGGGRRGGGGVLYVGARGAVYALSARNISSSLHRTIEWEATPDQKRQCLNKGRDNKTECFNHIRFLQRFNSTHLYTCGTHAFKPLCAYIDAERFKISSGLEEGREKCPYDPAKGYTGLLIDEQMYTASQYEFRSSPDIRRNSPGPSIKTEEAPTRWLLEADFVSSALVRESGNSSLGDDDKIYFFFTEKSQEPTAFSAQGRVARIARICKGDRGGHLTLQRKWTSFLKARLVCSLPDYQLHFNVLRSVFTLSGATAQDTRFYGIFGLEWKNVKASAVCEYSMHDVWQVFEGPYMESQDSSFKWSQYSGKVPEPRPGSCITDRLRARGVNSSFELPDDVLHFVRRHPLMFQPVQPRLRRPLLFKRSVDYTRLAVHSQDALDGHSYNVLFMGTDEGWLHRAVEIEGRVHIMEELQLFEEAQPVESIVISTAQKSVYVGSASEVVQLPMSTCGRYGSCYDCVFSRDPFCAWDGHTCVEVSSRSDRSNLVQDVQQGSRGCANDTADVLHRSRSVTQGDDVLLQCELSSNVASPEWTLDDQRLQGYGLDSGFRVGTDGLLLIAVRTEQSGRYRCFALENGVSVLMAVYDIVVRTERVPPVQPPPQEPTLLPDEDLDVTADIATDPPRIFTSHPPRQTSTSNPPHTSTTTTTTTTTTTMHPPDSPRTDFLSVKNMEAMYLSLVTILGGLCLVLTVVLLYVGFCVSTRRGKYSLSRAQRYRCGTHSSTCSTPLELRTVSSHCNGTCRSGGGADIHADGYLQIVPGEGQVSPSKEHHNGLPPAPPLPPPPLPDGEFPNGLAATLPSVLRRMNGNSYVLLQQSDSDTTSPLYYSFTDELNRILEKRKHTQLVSTPDESSV